MRLPIVAAVDTTRRSAGIGRRAYPFFCDGAFAIAAPRVPSRGMAINGSARAVTGRSVRITRLFGRPVKGMRRCRRPA